MVKIKVPKEIKSCTHPYKIKFNPRLWIEESLQGCINHITQILTIESALPQSQRDETLIHEILESINKHYRLRMDDDTIERMAHGFAEFLFSELGIEFDWSNIKELSSE